MSGINHVLLLNDKAFVTQNERATKMNTQRTENESSSLNGAPRLLLNQLITETLAFREKGIQII